MGKKVDDIEIPEKQPKHDICHIFLEGRTYHAFAIWFPASGDSKFNNNHGGNQMKSFSDKMRTAAAVSAGSLAIIISVAAPPVSAQDARTQALE